MKFPQIIKYNPKVIQTSLKILVGQSPLGFPIMVGPFGKEFVQNSSPGNTPSDYWYLCIVQEYDHSYAKLTEIQKDIYCRIESIELERQEIKDKMYEDLYV